MSDSTEGSTGVDQLRVRVAEVAALLTKRAPNLCPNVAPRQYKMAASNVLSICATAKQRADAEAFLASKASEVARDHERENEEEDEEEGRTDREKGQKRHVVLKTETDFDTRTFRIASAKFAGKAEATLNNLALLMELHLNASPEELELYSKRFASANQLDPDLPAASALQEVCGLAYALQVAASNMPGWIGYVGSFRLPLADNLDMTSVLRELFETASPPQSTSPPTSAAKKKASGSRASRSKSKPKGAGGGSKAGGTGGAGRGGGEGAVVGRKNVFERVKTKKIMAQLVAVERAFSFFRLGTRFFTCPGCHH